ncbi:Uncharacterized protein PBTT_07455 [Plasmodiophora brassicae]
MKGLVLLAIAPLAAWAQTVVKPTGCELVINDFSNADAFSSNVNALGLTSREANPMISTEQDDDHVVFTPAPTSSWYTTFREDGQCFDGSNFDYLSVTIAAQAGFDMALYVQSRPSDCSPGAGALITRGAVSIGERVTITDANKITIDIPLSDFVPAIPNGNLMNLVIGGLTGPASFYKISLKASCASPLAPRPRTPPPPPCALVVNDFVKPGSVNNLMGSTSDDGSMAEAWTIRGGSAHLVAQVSKHSYFYTTSPGCLDVSKFDYLHVQVVAPPTFSMRIVLQQVTDCSTMAPGTKPSVNSIDYRYTYDGQTPVDLYIPLAAFTGLTPTRISSVFFDQFHLRSMRSPDYTIQMEFNVIEFVRSSCGKVTPPEVAPKAVATCGWHLNDFEDYRTALTTNKLGGNCGDAGTMADMKVTDDGRLSLTSQGSGSYWFSHAYDTCKSLKKNIYYLSMDVEPMSGPGFDMRVDLVTAVDCNDDSKGLVTRSVLASEYVTFPATGPITLYIPLTDFPNYDGSFTAIQVAAFRNTNVDRAGPHTASPQTVLIDNVGFREGPCSDVPPLPDLPCALVVESYAGVPYQMNELGELHGDEASMQAVAVRDGYVELTSKDASSYYFTTLPACYNLEAFDGIWLSVSGPVGGDFLIRVKVATGCVPDGHGGMVGGDVRDVNVRASQVVGATGLSGQKQDLFLLFQSLPVAGGFNKARHTIVNIVIGDLTPPGTTHHNAAPMTLQIYGIELRPIICPTRKPRPTWKANPDGSYTKTMPDGTSESESSDHESSSPSSTASPQGAKLSSHDTATAMTAAIGVGTAVAAIAAYALL